VALTVINILVTVVLGLLLIPMLFLLLEILTAMRRSRRQEITDFAGNAPAVAVLVPAHDEEKVLGQALTAISPQLAPSDRLVVIADNCTDSTPILARKFGAEVVERNDLTRIGKGYALDAGARYLEAKPPDVVVVIDADCVPEEGAVSHLSRAAFASGGPVQCAYLMTAPVGSRRETQLREAMILLKNLVRPLGLYHLGFPCLLTGSGMAFPWPIFRDAPLASGNRVDDLQLAVDLAIAGSPAEFCPSVHVTNVLPAEPSASRLQRSGWMQGHLRTLVKQVPHLIGAALKAKRFALAVLALELSVPPLSMLILLWLIACAFALAVSWAGATVWPLVPVVLGTAALLASGSLFWTRFVHDRVPAKALLAIPLMFRHSISAALAAAFTKPKPWVRTSR